MTSTELTSWPRLLRSGARLEKFTVGWNLTEAIVGLIAGLAAGSGALVAFALDSVVESSSGAIVLWRLRAERLGTHTREEAERKAVRGVAIAFFALASYVGIRAVLDLFARARPETSLLGILLTVVSLVVMPVLAWRKRQVARRLDSRSLEADSVQTAVCTYLSAIVLVGLALNATAGWWWADPAAAFGVAVFAGREGWSLRHTEDFCCTIQQ